MSISTYTFMLYPSYYYTYVMYQVMLKIPIFVTSTPFIKGCLIVRSYEEHDVAVYEVDSMEGIPSNLKEFLAKIDVVEKFEERNYTQISVKRLVYSRKMYKNDVLLSRGYFPLNLHFLVADPGGGVVALIQQHLHHQVDLPQVSGPSLLLYPLWAQWTDLSLVWLSAEDSGDLH